jgi:uncharacterized FAD-dependent dehydrogenase
MNLTRSKFSSLQLTKSVPTSAPDIILAILSISLPFAITISAPELTAIPAALSLVAIPPVPTPLPEYISEALCEGVTGCSRYIKGFDMDDAVFAGVESRTSSPVRITRNDELMSVGCAGLYPCGEGAGYAGGITSAAVDGIKIAEKIAANIDFFKEV